MALRKLGGKLFRDDNSYPLLSILTISANVTFLDYRKKIPALIMSMTIAKKVAIALRL